MSKIIKFPGKTKNLREIENQRLRLMQESLDTNKQMYIDVQEKLMDIANARYIAAIVRGFTEQQALTMCMPIFNNFKIEEPK